MIKRYKNKIYLKVSVTRPSSVLWPKLKRFSKFYFLSLFIIQTLSTFGLFLTFLSFVHHNRTVNLSWSVWIDISLAKAAQYILASLYINKQYKLIERKEKLLSICISIAMLLSNSKKYLKTLVLKLEIEPSSLD